VAEQEIQLARQGTATDPVIAALVAYGRQLIAAPAKVSDAQIAELRDYGYSDEQVAEVVALVALQQLSGAFNLVTGIEPTVEAVG
jgi:alkylhydroperoxidase family enzyme